MNTGTCDRQTERRWRHLANWLWLAPVLWWGLSGIYYAITKDSTTVLSLVFVPWWMLLAGINGYVLVLLNARWGKWPVVVAMIAAAFVGGASFSVAGIHSALSCGLMAPVILGGGLLRIPPSANRSKPRAVIATVLGVTEPFVFVAGLVAVSALMIDQIVYGIPNIWLWFWWVIAASAPAILIASFCWRRSWVKLAKNMATAPSSEPPLSSG
jgi:hypothetical protein